MTMCAPLTGLAVVTVVLLVGCETPAPDPTPRAQSAAPETAPVAPEPPPIDLDQVSSLSGVLTQSAAAGQLRHLAGRRALIGRVTLDGVLTGRGVAMLGGLDSEAIDFDALNEGRFLLDVPDKFDGGVLLVTFTDPFVGNRYEPIRADQARFTLTLKSDDIDTIDIEFVRPQTVNEAPLRLMTDGELRLLDKRVIPVLERALGALDESRFTRFTRGVHDTAQMQALRESGLTLWARSIVNTRYWPSPPPGESCAFRVDDGPRQTVAELSFIELPGDRPPRTKLTVEMCPIPYPSSGQDAVP